MKLRDLESILSCYESVAEQDCVMYEDKTRLLVDAGDIRKIIAANGDYEVVSLGVYEDTLMIKVTPKDRFKFTEILPF